MGERKNRGACWGAFAIAEPGTISTKGSHNCVKWKLCSASLLHVALSIVLKCTLDRKMDTLVVRLGTDD